MRGSYSISNVLDALNLNNHSIFSLSADYYFCCFPSSHYQVLETNGTATKSQDLLSTDITNFLLGISFAADSSHMEGLARTKTDINWTIHGKSVLKPLTGVLDVNNSNMKNKSISNDIRNKIRK
jgi:hypothetical protein